MSLHPPVGPDDHVRGASTPEVTIVEYGDYQCPYCGQAEPLLERLLAEHGDRVALVFRNFPLTEMHPQALAAALTAEYAGTHDAFWPAHDTLFAEQDRLGSGLYEAIIEQLGLSVPDFERSVTDLSNPLHQRIETDFEGGIRSGANGTPAFFVNGQRYDRGAQQLVADIAELLRSTP